MKIKKRFRYILLSFFMCFLFIDDVFAEDMSFSIKTDYINKEVIKGNEETIKVNLTSSSKEIQYCWFTVSSSDDEKIKYVSSNSSNNWNKEDESNGVIRLKNNNVDADLSAGVNVISLKYKINDAGKVTIKSQCATSLDGEKKDGNSVDVEYTVIDPAADTSIKSILINGTPLPNFDSNVFEYSAPPLDNSKFSLKIETNNPDYQDDIVVKTEKGDVLNPDNIEFKSTNDQGYMLINITVNDKTKYEILFKYEAPNLDSSLSSLKINGDTIKLEKGRYNYTYKLSDKATGMTVEAVLVDEKNFMFEDGDGVWTYGKNDLAIAIVIKPKSSVVGVGTTTYTVTIERDGVVAQKPSSNKPSNNTPSNPQTGNISMFVMAIVLIVSLVGSIILYKRNIENYNG